MAVSYRRGMSFQGPPSWNPPPGGWQQHGQQHPMQQWHPQVVTYVPACPGCGSTAPPIVKGGAHWLVAIFLLFMCFIPGLVYLVTAKEQRVCGRCGTRLG